MRRLAVGLAAVLAACGGDRALLQDGAPAGTPVQSTPPGTHPDSGTPGPSCASDCDCGAGTHCQPAQGEAPAACVPGTNTCPHACSPACPMYQTCNSQTGTCVALQCPSQVTCGAGFYCDPSGVCQPNANEISVDGVWNTSYTMDVHQFAQNAGTVLVVLDLLDALLTGQANCTTQSTPTGQLLCFIFDLVGAQVQAPAWVGQLLTTLEDLFKFGSSPVTAQGQMTLTQGANNTLTATETWSSLVVQYNGQQLDLMHSPALASAGQVAVTVHGFSGTRDANDVFLGPRDVSLDVNHFIIALVDVAIDAATNGQANDIAGLLDLAICNPLPPVDQAACDAAATALANGITATSGLGGFRIDHQDAPLFDTNHDGIADDLAMPNAPAALVGSMSNGIVSGGFGPTSSWYGTR